MSHAPSASRPASSRPRPSVLTSPEMTVIRRAISSSNVLPRIERRLSNASLRRISRCTRCAAEVRRPERTSKTSEQSGTARSRRSTTAVPRKPVDPVTAMRRPARACLIISFFLPNGRESVYQLVDRLAPMAVPSGTWPRAIASSTVRSRSFGTRGYDASSLDAIASELGVRKQTILYYFPTKEALLEAVIDRSADRAVGGARRRARPRRGRDGTASRRSCGRSFASHFAGRSCSGSSAR